MLIFVIPVPAIQAFLWLFALLVYLASFAMLNPSQELDGYYVLMDLFDRPQLRHRAFSWLINRFKKSGRQPVLWRAALTRNLLLDCVLIILDFFNFVCFLGAGIYF